ncbi:MAG: TIGR03621 family F420-dependent LLM class oxidoreductase [Actinomycetota bacterium]
MQADGAVQLRGRYGRPVVDKALRIGCVCRDPAPSRAAWRDRVRRIDGWGYDVLLLPDHLGQWTPFAPLIAAADATDRLRLGTHVLNVEFWNPVLLARESAAVDLLTDGRLELGFGAGYTESEFRAIGLRYPPARERVDHLAEAVPLVQRLLAGEEVTAVGHYRLERCTIGLRTAQERVPVMVGGNGDRVLQVAARHADIVGLMGFSFETARQSNHLSHFTWKGLADRVAHVRREAGARADALELSVLVQAVAVTDDRAGKAEEMASQFEQPAALLLDSPFVMIGSEDELADQIRRLRGEFGVTYVAVPERSAGTLARVFDRVR